MNTSPAAPVSLAARLAGLLTFGFLVAFAALWIAAALLLRGENATWFGLALFFLGGGLAIAAWRKKLRVLESWRSVALTWALLVPVLAWLAWDEADRAPAAALDPLVPAPAEAAASYALTLAYTAHSGAGPARSMTANPKFSLGSEPVDAADKWRAAVTSHRAEIAAEWEQLAPERAWLAELDRYPAIGDAPEVRFDTPLMNFSVLRRVVQVGCAEASARALAGRGAEALSLLQPFASVALKLERHGRTEIRLLMAARAMEKLAATMRFVLAQTPVPAEARAVLAAQLASRDAAEVAHRLAWLPYHSVRHNVIDEPGLVFALVADDLGIKPRWMIPAMSWLRPFVFLPHATANLMARWSDAAERILLDPDGTPGREAYRQIQVETVAAPIKNFGGRSLLALATPNYQSWGRRLQASEQARLAALQALRAP